jgi:hypothetical protein
MEDFTFSELGVLPTKARDNTDTLLLVVLDAQAATGLQETWNPRSRLGWEDSSAQPLLLSQM